MLLKRTLDASAVSLRIKRTSAKCRPLMTSKCTPPSAPTPPALRTICRPQEAANHRINRAVTAHLALGSAYIAKGVKLLEDIVQERDVETDSITKRNPEHFAPARTKERVTAAYRAAIKTAEDIEDLLQTGRRRSKTCQKKKKEKKKKRPTAARSR